MRTLTLSDCEKGSLGLSSFRPTDQLKYEHDRAVNRVVFGGQTGNWLMSGGQDGQMKLWVSRSCPLLEGESQLLTSLRFRRISASHARLP